MNEPVVSEVLCVVVMDDGDSWRFKISATELAKNETSEMLGELLRHRVEQARTYLLKRASGDI